MKINKLSSKAVAISIVATLSMIMVMDPSIRKEDDIEYCSPIQYPKFASLFSK